MVYDNIKVTLTCKPNNRSTYTRVHTHHAHDLQNQQTNPQPLMYVCMINGTN